ncbi:MAG: TonB family protein, partial [Acidobacteriota bacterium]
AYAEHLLALREALPIGFGVALPMARRAHMAQRLRAILDPTQRRTPHSRVSAAIAVLVIAASAVVGAALFTAPITYSSLEQIASTAQTPQKITVAATWPTPREAAPKDAEQYVRYIERGGDRPVVAPAPAQAAASEPDESLVPLRDAQTGAGATQVGPQPIPAGQFGAGAYRPGNGVANPIRIREVKPVYTDAALKAGLQGTVELEAVIGAAGTVTDVRVVRSLDDKLGLDENAKTVVRQTPFVPCKIGDTPVACLVVFELQFTPGPPTPIAAGQFGAGAYRFREKSGMEQPVRIRFVKPQYTPAAMRQKIEGAIELEFVIQADGSVSDVRVVSSLDTAFGLDEQAIKAIKATPFKPGTLNGVAVPILATASMQFTLR